MKYTKDNEHLIKTMTNLRKKSAVKVESQKQTVKSASASEQAKENSRRELELLLTLNHKL